jgi:hypothetical protein
VDKNTVSDQMISILDNYYNSNNTMSINYAKSMSCFGVDIAPRTYLNDVINIDAIDNKEINNITSDFLIIKLIEDKFLKNLMSGSYISKGHEYKTKILSDNTVLIAIPITQIKEVFKNINFDLVYFGSSYQYINDFNIVFNKINLKKKSFILFTHTPFSIFDSFKTSQINKKNLTQNIYSFSKVLNFFNKFNFHIIFKSLMNNKYSGVQKKFFKKIIYCNLLFKRE